MCEPMQRRAPAEQHLVSERRQHRQRAIEIEAQQSAQRKTGGLSCNRRSGQLELRGQAHGKSPKEIGVKLYTPVQLVNIW